MMDTPQQQSLHLGAQSVGSPTVQDTIRQRYQIAQEVISALNHYTAQEVLGRIAGQQSLVVQQHPPQKRTASPEELKNIYERLGAFRPLAPLNAPGATTQTQSALSSDAKLENPFLSQQQASTGNGSTQQQFDAHMRHTDLIASSPTLPSTGITPNTSKRMDVPDQLTNVQGSQATQPSNAPGMATADVILNQDSGPAASATKGKRRTMTVTPRVRKKAAPKKKQGLPTALETNTEASVAPPQDELTLQNALRGFEPKTERTG